MVVIKKVPKRVLDVVNKARKALDYRELINLKKGVANEGWDCPITNSIPGVKATGYDELICVDDVTAQTIAHAWAISYEDIYSEFHSLPMPLALSKFVCAFDSGKYPQLIKKKRSK